jgi:hypothetical protein
MANRLDLQAELEEILESPNVYFQPPASIFMKYRCIRYSRSGYDVKHANNKIYNNTRRYDGVVIDPDPDSDIPDKMLNHFQMCSFGSAYTADNLNHFPFTIYY